MKFKLFTLLSLFVAFASYAQDSLSVSAPDSAQVQSFEYTNGTIELAGNIGKIEVPPGFKYLDQKQAEYVLVDLWGNPKSEGMTLGMILPENQDVLDSAGYVFNIEYNEIGYVKDDDADDIDYDELLQEIKKDISEESKERVKMGLGGVSMIGWAAKPFYDEDKKILHWAKELKFDGNELNTLNYNIRILGRKGVMVLNAIASMPELPKVQKDIGKVLDIVKFNEGYKYENYDSSVDKVAAWTIGGLIAGKVLAKVGLWALIVKFGKFIILAIAAFFGFVWKRIRGKKNTKEEAPATPPAAGTPPPLPEEPKKENNQDSTNLGSNDPPPAAG